jgi:hypothetical protein
MATDMKDMLSEIFGTTAVTTKEASAAVAPTAEDLEKEAQVSFFSELCAAKQIDVSLLNNDQVNELFKVAMDMKAASDAENSPEAKAKKAKEEKDEKSKEASAAALAAADAEYQEKRAAATKVAEADAMGRIMAHAYVDELRKLAGEMPPAFAAAAAAKKNDKGDEKTEEKGDEKDEKAKEASARAAALITEFEKTKTAGAPASTPSLNELAGNYAIDLLKTAGVNADLATARINAVHVLGVPDGAKVASAANLDAAVHVRALEYCEAAGFPVDWTQGA